MTSLQLERQRYHSLLTLDVIEASLMSPFDNVTVEKLMPRSETGVVDLGSPHKWLVTLADGQLAIFKPAW